MPRITTEQSRYRGISKPPILPSPGLDAPNSDKISARRTNEAEPLPAGTSAASHAHARSRKTARRGPHCIPPTEIPFAKGLHRLPNGPWIRKMGTTLGLAGMNGRNTGTGIVDGPGTPGHVRSCHRCRSFDPGTTSQAFRDPGGGFRGSPLSAGKGPLACGAHWHKAWFQGTRTRKIVQMLQSLGLMGINKPRWQSRE